jgi:tetratricopeptide (TPR) repeat protein
MKIVSAFLIAGLIGLWATSDAHLNFSEIKKPFIAPPKHIEHFHLGYVEPMADTLWIRLLQDVGACKTEGETQDLPADGIANCNLGWTYRMADTITTLTPRFKMAYDVSATLLSIVGGDREGARLIFEKAVKQFPNDWSLHYRAAYHYLFEVKDEVRAAELLKRAGDLGAPHWVYALSARLYTKEGKIELATAILREYLEQHPDGSAAERVKQRLKEIESGALGPETQE